MPAKHTDPAERIRTKRIYEEAAGADGKRILVDRIWPRGMSKDRARLDRWDKEIAPSNDLRKWFHGNEGEWAEFAKRYEAELRAREAELDTLIAEARSGVITLLYSSANETHNNAVVLRDILLRRM